MNLVIDIGNTSTKIALYEGFEKISVSRINDLNCAEIDKILNSNEIKKAILSSVREMPQFINDLLFRNIRFVHVLSYKSKLPFSIGYETPETLGTDRIAAVAGAYRLSPGLEIMVIDAGSAITFDFLSGSIYLGGNISPGINMRFRALNQFTGKLPLESVSENYSFPGRNTADAIKAGVISGVVYEINEYIRTFEKKHVDNKIVLTGGDAGFLRDKINSGIAYEPDLVTDGLNYILEYNAK
jgi:type III pantothenate kinase